MAALVHRIDHIRNEYPKRTVLIHAGSGDAFFGHWQFDRNVNFLAWKCNARWNPIHKYWGFSSTKDKVQFVEELRLDQPEFDIIQTHIDHKPYNKVLFSTMSLASSQNAIVIQLPLPDGVDFRLSDFDGLVGFHLEKDEPQDRLAIIVGTETNIAFFHRALLQGGAQCSQNNPLSSGNPLKITLYRSAVTIECDVTDPMHCLLTPDGSGARGKLNKFFRWDGVITTTRGQLEKRLFPVAHLDIPKEELDRTPGNSDVSIIPENIPGWSTPALNGHLLHAYQREGVLFCLQRSLRAIIGDDMGIGKTAEAIASAEASKQEKILILCPANARYVWDREIMGWSSGGKIQHITSQLDSVDPDARWIIATYDQIVTRTETWRIRDDLEQKQFLEAFPDTKAQLEKKKRFPKSISIDTLRHDQPIFIDPKRQDAWSRMMQRLNQHLLQQLEHTIETTENFLLIMDEAHRLKNNASKRTRAIKRLTSYTDIGTLLLTGTPIRNNEKEILTLLSLVDHGAELALSERSDFTRRDIRECLAQSMIRRTKREVLPQLPDKIRQQIPIAELDAEHLSEYYRLMGEASQAYLSAINDKMRPDEARRAALGWIELARIQLGLSKVAGGTPADLISDVVENKGCCVVFAAHHEISDTLAAQLRDKDLNVATLDGRTIQKRRAQLTNDFQSGQLDVLILGIISGGEAISLTRADVSVFIEMDWVPAAMLQAEDRIHRVGQRRSCQILQLTAEIGRSQNLDEIMTSIIERKLRLINALLEEEKNQAWFSLDKVNQGTHSEVLSRLLECHQ